MLLDFVDLMSREAWGLEKCLLLYFLPLESTRQAATLRNTNFKGQARFNNFANSGIILKMLELRLFFY